VLDDLNGLQIVEGLTASAQLVSSQVTDVLRVPSAAITGTFTQPAVNRVTETGTETVPVQIGASDGTWVEIVSGLEEGDTVVATFAGGLGLNTGDTQTFIPGGGVAFTIGEGPGGFGGDPSLRATVISGFSQGGGGGGAGGRGGFGGGGQ
jgi:hypothetical protein